MNRQFARRTFLGGLGAATALSPFIPLFNASGQESGVPKRLVLFYTPHGTVWNRWKPTGTATNFTLSPILKPLERHQSKLTILAGLNMPDAGVGAPHTKGPSLLWGGSTLLDDGSFQRSDCSGGCTFGWNSTPSIDQLIIQATSPSTAYSSLQFGVFCGGSRPQSRMVYTAAQKPLDPEVDPWAAFGRLFGGNVTGSAELEALRAERRSVLDLVAGELTALRQKAPSADQHKLDAHLESIRNIERRFDASAAACSPPERLKEGKLDAGNRQNTPTLMEGHFDLIAAALACDMTRFASYQHTVGDNDNMTYTWLGHDTGHHTMSHAGDDDAATWAKLEQIQTWYAEKLAGLLDRLDAVPEGSGTMLDNTLVVWGTELGKPNSHSFQNTPFILAGGGGGAIMPGRFLTFPEGTQHNRLLVSLARVMGVNDVDKVGNLDQGSGPLPGLLA
jgi:hypothetical protein